MLTINEKQKIRENIKQNSHEVYILSLDEMDHVIQKGVKSNTLKEQWSKLKSKVEFSASYYSYGTDAVLVARIFSDLGYAGTQAYIKYYGGKAHIVFKGRPGLRAILNGTKYGVQNVKIVKMGIGKHGAIAAAKVGGALTVILVTAFRVIDYFLTDSMTLSRLIGTLSTDVVKIGIATGASIGVVSGLAAIGVVAVIGPLVVAILVGVGVSLLLGYLDEEYNVTEKVIEALDEISEGVLTAVKNQKQAIFDAGNEYINKAAESVVDYTIETVQKIIINTAMHVIGKLMRPPIR